MKHLRKTIAISSLFFCFVLSQEIIAQKRPKARKKVPTISCGVCNQKAIFLPQPKYPATAKIVNAGGYVQVQILINELGKVQTAKAVVGHPLLRAAAVEAALRAKFEPFFLGKRMVRVSGTIIYNFVR